MYVTGILALVLFLHGNVTFSWMPVYHDAEVLKATTETAKENNATSPAPVIKCKTGKNLTGSCVPRARCDHGPGAIDLTLYAPRWYKKPCKVDEVCCPYEFIMVQSQTDAPTLSDDYFDFDDYDDY